MACRGPGSGDKKQRRPIWGAAALFIGYAVRDRLPTDVGARFIAPSRMEGTLTDHTTERVCPDCGHPMVRDEARPLTLNYKGLSVTFPMPGFYCVNCGEGVHNGKDMEASDRALNLLKAQVESRPPPTEA